MSAALLIIRKLAAALLYYLITAALYHMKHIVVINMFHVHGASPDACYE